MATGLANCLTCRPVYPSDRDLAPAPFFFRSESWEISSWARPVDVVDAFLTNRLFGEQNPSSRHLPAASPQLNGHRPTITPVSRERGAQTDLSGD